MFAASVVAIFQWWGHESEGPGVGGDVCLSPF
jgi:hypothetical protein